MEPVIRTEALHKHFGPLHAVDGVVSSGTSVADYVIHRSDGTEDRLPIRYGCESRPWDWDVGGVGLLSVTRSWRGTGLAGLPVCLFRTTWTNTQPDTLVTTIDLVSTMEGSSPFVVAITAE